MILRDLDRDMIEEEIEMSSLQDELLSPCPCIFLPDIPIIGEKWLLDSLREL